MGMPLSLNRYSYVEDNVANRRDPSGLMAEVDLTLLKDLSGCQSNRSSQSTCAPRSGNTTCEQVISDVRCIIEKYRQQQGILGFLINENDVILSLLSGYFAGIDVTMKIEGHDTGIWTGPLPAKDPTLHGLSGYDNLPVPPEPTPGAWSDDNSWRNPVYDEKTTNQAAITLRGQYGFRSPYYTNMHHFFFYLNSIYENGIVAEWFGAWREGAGQMEEALTSLHKNIENANGNPTLIADAKARYAWVYRDAINDLYVAHKAGEIGDIIRREGIDRLPELLQNEFCAKPGKDMEKDIWSLKGVVDEYYYRLNSTYWPENN
jgi:hypothetical protein